MLGLVRGTLDGTPLDKDFPRYGEVLKQQIADNTGDHIGQDAYATEGWATSNRGWLSTLTFSTLHSITLHVVDASSKKISKVSGNKKAYVELRAPLNLNPSQKEKAWVEKIAEGGKTERIELTETAPDSGVFRALLTPVKGQEIMLGYGYWGFRKETSVVFK